MKRVSERGKQLIRQFEGLRLEAYRDPAGVLTIGYGHTGPDVKPGMTITVEDAERLLQEDLRRFEQAVNEAVTVPITQNQFDALCSFCYNVGIAAFKRSTLLAMLNRGNYVGASREFDRWVKARNKVLPGLVRRRAAERALFTQV